MFFFSLSLPEWGTDNHIKWRWLAWTSLCIGWMQGLQDFQNCQWCGCRGMRKEVWRSQSTACYVCIMMMCSLCDGYQHFTVTLVLTCQTTLRSNPEDYSMNSFELMQSHPPVSLFLLTENADILQEILIWFSFSPWFWTAPVFFYHLQGGSNMTGTNCDLFTHK